MHSGVFIATSAIINGICSSCNINTTEESEFPVVTLPWLSMTTCFPLSDFHSAVGLTSMQCTKSTKCVILGSVKLSNVNNTIHFCIWWRSTSPWLTGPLHQGRQWLWWVGGSYWPHGSQWLLSWHSTERKQRGLSAVSRVGPKHIQVHIYILLKVHYILKPTLN